jgi:hypothetical protein
MKTISIAKDFSPTPGGRYNRDGPYSGEAFRTRFLEPAIDAGERVIVDLDMVAGLPSSFLEEAFGGLLRVRAGLTADQVIGQIQVSATEPDLQTYKTLIRRYVTEAAARAAKAK